MYLYKNIKITNMNTCFSCNIRVIINVDLCIVYMYINNFSPLFKKQLVASPIPHTHFVNKLFLTILVKIFKSRLRVIGTKEWNQEITVSVRSDVQHGSLWLPMEKCNPQLNNKYRYPATRPKLSLPGSSFRFQLPVNDFLTFLLNI